MKAKIDSANESTAVWLNWCLTIGFLVAAGSVSAQEGFTPPEVPADEIYTPLKQTSPFRRTLDISETYALRGVARLDDITVATVYNKETKKTVVVTPDAENDAGLKLVEVIPGRQLEGVTAKVSFAGEVAELRYDAEQIQPKATPGDHRGHGNGDQRRDGSNGERRGPSKEDMERFQKLTDDQKAKFRSYVGDIVRKYPDMPREERGAMIRGALVRLSERNELPPGGSSSGGGDQRGGGKDSRSR